jgi:predicted enzyme related to lactoylglutathione lyase
LIVNFYYRIGLAMTPAMAYIGPWRVAMMAVFRRIMLENTIVRKFHFALVMAALVMTACSTSNINIPAIGGAADGERLPGKIIWHELLTDTPQETQQFYSGLFGWQFESLPDQSVNYQLIRHQGKLIGGMIDQNQLPTKADISQWVTLVAVTDIDAAAQAVRDNNGTVFTPPTSLGERGMIAVVADPQGALFALLEAGDGEPADDDEVPGVGEFLWNELWAEEIDSAAAFYRTLAPYQIEEKNLGGTGEPVAYKLLSTHNHKRAGIRKNPVEGLPPIWVNYLRVADDTQLDAILARVEALGGEILVPAIQRPGGGTVAIIAGPSGAGVALQTWTDDQRIIEASGEAE